MDPENVDPTGGATESVETPGVNPAWNDVLSVIPPEFHGQITPHFQKWDQSAQERIESINTKFKGFEPFTEHGITPEQIFEGLQLMQEINTNPQAIYQALVESYGFGNQTPQSPTPPATNPENESQTQVFQDSRVDELKQGLDLVSQIILQEQQAKEAKALDSALENELNAAFAKYENLPRNEDAEYFVLAQMQTKDLTAEQAMDAYSRFIASINPPFAPKVLGSTGGTSGLPSNAIDPTKMSGQETRSLVAQMLAQAAQQRNG